MNIILTGGSGQDAYWMCKYLLANTEANIYLTIRPSTNHTNKNTDEFRNVDRVSWVSCDLADSVSVDNLVKALKPDYLINFAAMSFVGDSWNVPEYVMNINTTGVIRLLEAIRKYVPDCRFYQAGSSEEMGNVDYVPQNEKHPAKARSIYGASKIAARQVVKVYRESYGLYAISGWLYNHESEAKRDERFITRKITRGVARIIHSLKANKPFEPIKVGNVDSKRDWSHSLDFADGIWRMMNQEKFNPLLKGSINLLAKKQQICDTKWLSNNIKEYVLASGEAHSIRELIELAFAKAGIMGYWTKEKNLCEIEAYRYDTRSDFGFLGFGVPNLVEIDPKFYRPADVELLCGDSSLARNELGWKPSISFNELVERMVKWDISNYEKY